MGSRDALPPMTTPGFKATREQLGKNSSTWTGEGLARDVKKFSVPKDYSTIIITNDNTSRILILFYKFY
jgi:hypothetical protein